MKNAGQLATPNDEEACNLQMVFIEEEFYELLHAHSNLKREDVIKEACDVVWVTYGLLLAMGVNIDEAYKSKLFLSKAYNLDPDNIDVAILYSKACHFIGHYFEKDLVQSDSIFI